MSAGTLACSKCGGPLAETLPGYRCDRCGQTFETSKGLAYYRLGEPERPPAENPDVSPGGYWKRIVPVSSPTAEVEAANHAPGDARCNFCDGPMPCYCHPTESPDG